MRTRFYRLVPVLALFLLFGCTGDGNSQDEGEIELVSAQRGSLTVSITAVGSVSPRTKASLSFGTAGQVRDVLVETGERVRRGQEMIRLDTSDLEVQINSAEAALAAAQAQLEQLQAGARHEEIAMAQAKLDAAEAQLAGGMANLAELQDEPDENQIAAAEANLRTAQANVWLATVQRDQITDGATAGEIAALEAQLASALAQQKIARDAHDQTLKCETVTLPNGEKKEVCPALGTLEEQARYNLNAADEAVAAAQTQLEQLLEGPTERQVDTANANLTATLAQRDAVQAQLEQLQAGASTAQLQAAEANVAALTAQRDVAQAQLEMLLAGATAAEFAVAQANVAQARTALEQARLALERAVLKAPFDGVVTHVSVTPGEFIAIQVPVATLVDDGRFRIEIEVDEADIGSLETAQEVHLTFDAFPTQTLMGRVVAIADSATLDAGIVSYAVTIEIDPTELPLRDGMTVNAEIVVGERTDTLLVPNRAIWIDADTGRLFVEKMVDGEVVTAVIEQGLANDEFSEVLDGLTEGDQLIVRSTSIRDRFRDLVTMPMTGQ
jgi:HlyD family secretion protein